MTTRARREGELCLPTFDAECQAVVNTTVKANGNGTAAIMSGVARFEARRLHVKARVQTRFLLNRYRVWQMDGVWR